MSSFYKKYAPNPRLKRDDYEFLCGEWDFAFADGDCEPLFDKKIQVPFSYECKASGIGDESSHECIWYKRTFNVKEHRGAVLLHFEGIDYHSFIYLNDQLVTEHVGGFTTFSIDATKYVKVGKNEIKIKVNDSFDKSQLRGKQRARGENYDCWYVQTTGIYKPVWLEYAGNSYLKNISFKTQLGGKVEAEFSLNKPAKVEFTVYEDGTRNAVYHVKLLRLSETFTLNFVIDNAKSWSAEKPNLYSVKVVVDDYDEVYSYFGFCNVTTKPDGVYINGKREFQQMILYQGYWEDTMLSAPNDVALEKDVQNIKAMGFNGVRVHQKVENEVFYYLCDKYGLYVWGEIPSPYEFTPKMQSEFSRDCEIIFNQLKNHVCITTWLLFNETWGVSAIKDNEEIQDYVMSEYQKIKEKDSRPIITNDGWYHLNSDVLSIHEYEQNAKVFEEEYKDKTHLVTKKVVNENRYGTAFANGFTYKNQPIMISEYGGIAIKGEGWGYGDMANDIASFKQRLRDIVATVNSIPYLSGCCYTQYNDIQQEINGLIDKKGHPKLPISLIHDIFFNADKGRR